MIRQAQIDAFLSTHSIAVVGVSRNPKKFGNSIYKGLLSKGFSCIPVNPNMDEFDQKPCYKDLLSIPFTVDACVIITATKNSDVVFKQAIEKGIKNIWVQQMSETPYIKEYAKTSNVNIIIGKCLLMFIEPVGGLHGFHRFVLNLFGKLPK